MSSKPKWCVQCNCCDFALFAAEQPEFDQLSPKQWRRCLMHPSRLLSMSTAHSVAVAILHRCRIALWHSWVKVKSSTNQVAADRRSMCSTKTTSNQFCCAKKKAWHSSMAPMACSACCSWQSPIFTNFALLQILRQRLVSRLFLAQTKFSHQKCTSRFAVIQVRWRVPPTFSRFLRILPSWRHIASTTLAFKMHIHFDVHHKLPVPYATRLPMHQMLRTANLPR